MNGEPLPVNQGEELKQHVWGPRLNGCPGVRCEDCFQAAWEPHQNTPCEGESGTKAKFEADWLKASASGERGEDEIRHDMVQRLTTEAYDVLFEGEPEEDREVRWKWVMLEIRKLKHDHAALETALAESRERKRQATSMLDEIRTAVANERAGNLEHLIATAMIGKHTALIGRKRHEQLVAAEQANAALVADRDRLRAEVLELRAWKSLIS